MASSLDTIGPITKTVEDAALVLEAIAGKDPLDATTSDVPVPEYAKALSGNVKGLRVGVPKEYFIDGMSEEVRKAVLEAIEVLKSLGAVITDISATYTSFQTTNSTAATNFNVRCTTSLVYALTLDTLGPVTDNAIALDYTLAFTGANGAGSTGNGVNKQHTVTATIASGQSGTCAGPAPATCSNATATNKNRTLKVTY